MQIQIKHISTGESGKLRGGEKQFIHGLPSQDSNGWFVGGGGWVRRNNQANTGSRWVQCDVGTIEEGTACSTLRMSRVVIWRQFEAGGNGWQIEPAILLATHDDPHPAREELDENGCGAIQAIQTNQDVREWHTEPARIADDGLACASQFPPIVPIARSTEGA